MVCQSTFLNACIPFRYEFQFALHLISGGKKEEVELKCYIVFPCSIVQCIFPILFVLNWYSFNSCKYPLVKVNAIPIWDTIFTFTYLVLKFIVPYVHHWPYNICFTSFGRQSISIQIRFRGSRLELLLLSIYRIILHYSYSSAILLLSHAPLHWIDLLYGSLLLFR